MVNGLRDMSFANMGYILFAILQIQKHADRTIIKFIQKPSASSQGFAIRMVRESGRMTYVIAKKNIQKL